MVIYGTLKSTAFSNGAELKPLPVIVTSVPTSAGLGEMLWICGAPVTAKVSLFDVALGTPLSSSETT